MEIVLFSNKSDNRKLNKEITSYGKIQVTLKDECTVINPKFLIKATQWKNIPIYGVNYCYVSSFNRFYYIDDIKYESGNTIEITCSVDVLMSYKNEINNLICLIDRQENIVNPELTDELIKLNSNRKYNLHKASKKVFSKGTIAGYNTCVAITVNGGAI